MKALFFLSAFIFISCTGKDEQSPLKMIGSKLELSAEGYGTVYTFTARNEGDSIIDSFTVAITLIDSGDTKETINYDYPFELVPFEEGQFFARFNYVVKNDSSVTFKYRFE